MFKSKFKYAGFDNAVAVRSDYNGDGRLYPNTAVVLDCGDHLQIWDATGWDGFKQVPSYCAATVTKEKLTPAAYEHLAITIAEEISCTGIDQRQVIALKNQHDILLRNVEDYRNTLDSIQRWWNHAHPDIPFNLNYITR